MKPCALLNVDSRRLFPPPVFVEGESQRGAWGPQIQRFRGASCFLLPGGQVDIGGDLTALVGVLMPLTGAVVVGGAAYGALRRRTSKTAYSTTLLGSEEISTEVTPR